MKRPRKSSRNPTSWKYGNSSKKPRPIEPTGAGQMGILGGTGVATGAWV